MFSFGVPRLGSLGPNPLARALIGNTPTMDGNGHYLLDADGSIRAFGDDPYEGGP